MMHVVLLIALALTADNPAAQDTLEPIRELYASADYEGALTALDRLGPDKNAGRTTEIDRFRVLCLVALGRSDEANAVIERIVADDPLHEFSATDAPPRIRAALTEVRRRLLPGMVRGWYAEGKAAFDRKAFPEAVEKLEKVVQVLESADVGGADLADLRTLADGFLELSRKLVDVPAAPVIAPPASALDAAPAPAATAVKGDSDPVAVRQDVPPWVGSYAGALYQREFRGVIEVEIDENGQVVGAEITVPIHPSYDPQLLKAARDWRYQPARQNGAPVKARKRVEIVLKPR